MKENDNRKDISMGYYDILILFFMICLHLDLMFEPGYEQCGSWFNATLASLIIIFPFAFLFFGLTIYSGLLKRIFGKFYWISGFVVFLISIVLASEVDIFVRLVC